MSMVDEIYKLQFIHINYTGQGNKPERRPLRPGGEPDSFFPWNCCMGTRGHLIGPTALFGSVVGAGRT